MKAQIIAYTQGGSLVIEFGNKKIELALTNGGYQAYRLVGRSEQVVPATEAMEVELGTETAQILSQPDAEKVLFELSVVRSHDIDIIGNYNKFSYLYLMNRDNYYSCYKALELKKSLEIQSSKTKLLEVKLAKITEFINSGAKITAKTTDGIVKEWEKIQAKNQAKTKKIEAKAKADYMKRFVAKFGKDAEYIEKERNLWSKGTKGHFSHNGKEKICGRLVSRGSSFMTIETIEGDFVKIKY